jgi:hypothetical protein
LTQAQALEQAHNGAVRSRGRAGRLAVKDSRTIQLAAQVPESCTSAFVKNLVVDDVTLVLLVKLLFLQKIQYRGALQKLFENLCLHPVSRVKMLKTMICTLAGSDVHFDDLDLGDTAEAQTSAKSLVALPTSMVGFGSAGSMASAPTSSTASAGAGRGSFDELDAASVPGQVNNLIPNTVSRRILSILSTLCDYNNRNMVYILSDGETQLNLASPATEGSEMDIDKLDINATSSPEKAPEDAELQDVTLPTTFKPLSFLLALLSRMQFQKSSNQLDSLMQLLEQIVAPLEALAKERALADTRLLLQQTGAATNAAEQPPNAPAAEEGVEAGAVASGVEGGSDATPASAEPKVDSVPVTATQAQALEQTTAKVPLPVIPSRFLHCLAQILTVDTCMDATFERATNVVLRLAVVSENHAVLVHALVEATQSLAALTVGSLSSLNGQLVRASKQDSNARGLAILTDILEVSSHERKLLRTLQIATKLRRLQKLSITGALCKSDEALEPSTSPAEEVVNAAGGALPLPPTPAKVDTSASSKDVLQNLKFDHLWDALSQCLSSLTGIPGLEQLATEAENLNQPAAHSASSSMVGSSSSSAASRTPQPAGSSGRGPHPSSRSGGAGSLVSASTPGVDAAPTSSASSLIPGLLGRFMPIIEAFFVANSPRNLDSLDAMAKDARLRRLSSHGLTRSDSTPDVAEGVHSPVGKNPATEFGDDESDAMGSDASRLATFVETHRVIINKIVRLNPTLLEKNLLLMVKHPTCKNHLEFDNKRLYFRSQLKRLRKQASQRHGSLRLAVHRNQIFQDSFNKLRHKSPEEMRGKLNIAFSNEEGIDAGGVTREWFSVMAREMFNPNYALFKPTHDGATFQPNPISAVNQDHLDYFKFVGRVIGKAIADGQLMDVFFTRSFYKHILGIPVNNQDMQSIDPEYYKNFTQILNYDLETLGLEMNFETDVEYFGRKDTYELKPGGKNIAVTEDNKREYVSLMCKYKMTSAIKDQIRNFLLVRHLSFCVAQCTYLSLSDMTLQYLSSLSLSLSAACTRSKHCLSPHKMTRFFPN